MMMELVHAVKVGGGGRNIKGMNGCGMWARREGLSNLLFIVLVKRVRRGVFLGFLVFLYRGKTKR